MRCSACCIWILSMCGSPACRMKRPSRWFASIDRGKPAAAEEEVGHAFRQWLEEEPESWPRSLKDPSGDTDISILPLKLGLSGESGVIVAGCRRVDFPDQTERLVLEVAANQAAMGLQAARRLAEQQRLAAEDRKRAEIHLAGEKHVLEMIASGGRRATSWRSYAEFFEQAPRRIVSVAFIRSTAVARSFHTASPRRFLPVTRRPSKGCISIPMNCRAVNRSARRHRSFRRISGPTRAG